MSPNGRRPTSGHDYHARLDSFNERGGWADSDATSTGLSLTARSEQGYCQRDDAAC
jgi:hypothetical protein